MTQQNKVAMPRPNTDLDFQAQLTDPFTSSEFVDPAFMNKFKEYVYVLDLNGNIQYNQDGTPKVTLHKDLWGILQIFNRDWRWGNIDKKEEAVFIRHHINLTSDILNFLGDNFRQSALASLSYALCVNETSQAKGGFVRRILNTFIHKTNNKTEDNTSKRSGVFSSFAKKNKYWGLNNARKRLNWKVLKK